MGGEVLQDFWKALGGEIEVAPAVNDEEVKFD